LGGDKKKGTRKRSFASFLRSASGSCGVRGENYPKSLEGGGAKILSHGWDREGAADGGEGSA